MTAPIGAAVTLYVDLIAPVDIGDIIETQSGRRYSVLGVRVQQRGKHAGRQHLRALVVVPYGPAMSPTDEAVIATGNRVHKIRWYPRAKRKR